MIGGMRFQLSLRDVLLVVAILALAFGWWTDHQRIAPQAPRQWEYMSYEGFSGYGSELNSYGEAGWELCGLTAEGRTAILKRPKQ
jgi:hypothetical protein